MTNIKENLKKLILFTHYPRKNETMVVDNNMINCPSKSEMWDNWELDESTYENGVFILSDDVTIYDQTVLNSSGGEYGRKIKYIKTTTNNRFTYRFIIYYYYPQHYHNNQIVNFTFEDGEGHTINHPPYDLIVETGYVFATIILDGELPAEDKNGSLTVKINPYYDTVNNNYYTGVEYKVEYTNLTESYQSFPIIYKE